jgi:pilus assembly protein CpaE
MKRPVILLALAGESAAYVDALQRAGFEPVDPDALEVTGRNADLGVIDCELDPATVRYLYNVLHVDPAVPTLLMLGESSHLGPGIGGVGDEVAIKPLLPEALVYRLQALLIRTGRTLPTESGTWADEGGLAASAIAGEGRVISVFAPKGGVGKTTISINMAVALRLQTRAEVLLFDADVGVGNITSALEVPERLGLADLADSPPSEWTDAAFDHAVAIHAETGLRVLTWGTGPSQSIPLELMLAALRWARGHHSYVIVDNHPGYDERTMAMLAVANEIFLVVTPEVGSIRNSSQFLELAREIGLAGIVRVIVNRANHGIRTDDLAASLDMPIAATVMSNGPRAVVAANQGRPIITMFPREKISDDLHRVARLVSQPDGATETEPPRRAWWARLRPGTSEA